MGPVTITREESRWTMQVLVNIVSEEKLINVVLL